MQREKICNLCLLCSVKSAGLHLEASDFRTVIPSDAHVMPRTADHSRSCLWVHSIVGEQAKGLLNKGRGALECRFGPELEGQPERHGGREACVAISWQY